MDQISRLESDSTAGFAASESFRSILFGPVDMASAEVLTQPDCFLDLNLDQIVRQAIALKAEYDLAPFFHQALTDTDSVALRHAVFRDLDSLEIVQALERFSTAMRDLRKSEKQRKAFHHVLQKLGQLLISVEIYGNALIALHEDLSAANPASSGLMAFQDWLQACVEGESFQRLRTERASCQAALDGIRYSLLFRGDTVRVTRFSDTEDYSKVIAEIFAKFAQVEGHAYTWKFTDFGEMNHVEIAILENVVRLFPDAFRSLAQFEETWGDFPDPVILRFDREIQFYLCWHDLIAKLRRAGLSLVLPAMSNLSKTEKVAETYDLALALKLVAEGREIVTNDFALSGSERIIVVTGPNQGGKTTFARLFGQLHWLAALGLPVPGSEARLFLPDQVFTHFEHAETVQTERGKLEDEVYRIHEILDAANADSIIVINEIFASTSLADAVDLATRIMGQIIARESLAVCVTFLDEISRLGPSVVSMTSSIVPEDPARRTFRIIRQPADGNAFAIFLARRHGLTAEQLRERIPS